MPKSDKLVNSKTSMLVSVLAIELANLCWIVLCPFKNGINQWCYSLLKADNIFVRVIGS